MIAVAAALAGAARTPPIACPLRATTGVPCPFCGMTRAVVAAVHGHLGTSLSFNPGGVVVLLLARRRDCTPRVVTARLLAALGTPGRARRAVGVERRLQPDLPPAPVALTDRVVSRLSCA